MVVSAAIMVIGVSLLLLDEHAVVSLTHLMLSKAISCDITRELGFVADCPVKL